jgi:catechol 2,3-dioxygenase-like lactoylglutathione lyase family enzyme
MSYGREVLLEGGDMPSSQRPDLVPELLVTDVEASLRFWCGPCGFQVLYDRPDEGFSYITRGNAHLMLEQATIGRNWITGPLDPPLGRGINFQIAVDTTEPILSALQAADWPLFMAPETRSYRVDGEDIVVQQFLVTDPDGYLVRFSSRLDRRNPR